MMMQQHHFTPAMRMWFWDLLHIGAVMNVSHFVVRITAIRTIGDALDRAVMYVKVLTPTDTDYPHIVWSVSWDSMFSLAIDMLSRIPLNRLLGSEIAMRVLSFTLNFNEPFGDGRYFLTSEQAMHYWDLYPDVVVHEMANGSDIDDSDDSDESGDGYDHEETQRLLDDMRAFIAHS